MTRHCPTHAPAEDEAVDETRCPACQRSLYPTNRGGTVCIACRNEAKRARSEPEQKRAKSREGMRRLRAGRGEG